MLLLILKSKGKNGCINPQQNEGEGDGEGEIEKKRRQKGRGGIRGNSIKTESINN